MNRSLRVRGALVVFMGLIGCSDSQGSSDEHLATIGANIGEACSTSPATATFVGTINYVSPRTYNTLHCYKSVVVDVTGFHQETSAGGAGGRTSGVSNDVTIGLTPPLSVTTAPECNALWLGAYVYEKNDSGFTNLGFMESRGYAPDGGAGGRTGTGGFCTPPELVFRSAVVGKSYRFAASARADGTTEAPTVSLQIH